jgi:hypothetical protein
MQVMQMLDTLQNFKQRKLLLQDNKKNNQRFKDSSKENKKY